MAKASKPKIERKKRGKYDEPLKVSGSFMDIINASVKHAEKKSAEKRESKKKS